MNPVAKSPERVASSAQAGDAATAMGDGHMPKGPNGQIRPADVIGNAVRVTRIATGEFQDVRSEASGRQKNGAAGGQARSASLIQGERIDIARKAAEARWR